jgi:hypothetical protein
MNYENKESEFEQEFASPSNDDSGKDIKASTPTSLGNLIFWQSFVGLFSLIGALILFFAVAFVPVFNGICSATISFNQIIQGDFAQAISGNEWCLVYHRKIFLFVLSLVAAFGTGFGVMIVAAYRKVWGSFFLAFLMAYLWFGATASFTTASETSAPAISTLVLLSIAILGSLAAALGYNLKGLVVGPVKTPSNRTTEILEPKDQF